MCQVEKTNFQKFIVINFTNAEKMWQNRPFCAIKSPFKKLEKIKILYK